MIQPTYKYRAQASQEMRRIRRICSKPYTRYRFNVMLRSNGGLRGYRLWGDANDRVVTGCQHE